MRYFCTFSDNKYLLKGLTLYRSLLDVSTDDFKLFYLCLDEESLEILNKLNYDNILPIAIDELENKDEELLSLKKDRKVRAAEKGGKYTEYCWSMTPYIIWYILNNFDVDSLTYCDSDIYFFNDYSEIYREIGDKSVGIFRHRHNKRGCNAGEFNVGTLFFKNDIHGKTCSNWWKITVFDQDNKYAVEYGTCGDQKYLELFTEIFPEVVKVVDDKVGHLAPWNFKLYEYPDKEHIKWKNKLQKIVFSHFSHFVPDFNNNTYKESWNGEWGELLHRPDINYYYSTYFDTMKSMREQVKSNIGTELE